MGTKITGKIVERKKGFLYYVDKEGCVCEVEMAQVRRKREEAEKVKMS